MAVPAGPYIEPFVEQLAKRLKDVASQLYDLDQSTSLGILEGVDGYTGRTAEVLGDVAQDRQWLWPAYTEARERVDLAIEFAKQRNWDEARAKVATPLLLVGSPPHDDLEEAVTLIADTARAVLEVTLLVVPKIGEHLGTLTEIRSDLGALEEDAANVGMGGAAELLNARAAVDEMMERVSSDPLSVDPAMAQTAVKMARDAVTHMGDELRRLPRRMGRADALLLELDILIVRGREALERTREKIADPQGMLVPLSPDLLTAGPQALRPRLERLTRAASEGDNRAALVGMESWERTAQQVREQAERVVQVNQAPVARRDELRGLVGALRAKAAASGLAEDPQAQALHDEAKELLWVAPCDLAAAEAAVEAYRRFLADR